ncbi:MAG TPA: protease, partial [Actinomycetota bacterium]|nr:protease [Actinomycetota bacterium]
ISGRPEGLASALRKIESAAKEKPMEVNPAAASLFIVNPLSGMGRSMIKMFSTHPPTEERIRRLESMMTKV